MPVLKYKKIDIMLQIAVMLVTVYLSFILRDFEGVIALVVLGVVQLSSAIVHFFFDKFFWASRKRKIYYFLASTSLIITLLAVFSRNFEDSIYILFYMIIVTGLIAIYYLVVCILETRWIAGAQARQ